MLRLIASTTSGDILAQFPLSFFVKGLPPMDVKSTWRCLGDKLGQHVLCNDLMIYNVRASNTSRANPRRDLSPGKGQRALIAGHHHQPTTYIPCLYSMRLDFFLKKITFFCYRSGLLNTSPSSVRQRLVTVWPIKSSYGGCSLPATCNINMCICSNYSY